MSNEEIKAKAIVEKYLNEPINFPYIDTEDGRCIGSGYMTFNSAKQCAIIAVDLAIEEFGNYTGMYDQDFFDSEVKYLKSVKQAIQKL